MSKRCSKCGQPVIGRKNPENYCLDGYMPRPSLCNGCNATNSVIERLSGGGSITKKDLEKLPSVLVFNPGRNNPEEEMYGQMFQKLCGNARKI